MTRKFSKRGYDLLTTEINRLWNEERPMVLQEIHDAALQGDRSENAAYIYGKQRLRLIDKRLKVLRDKISDVLIIDTDSLPPSEIIDFGALVTIEDEDGNELQLRLVDQEESDPEKMWVSVQSPMGRALLGKAEGEDFELKLPRGTVNYDILHVHYGPDPEANDEEPS